MDPVIGNAVASVHNRIVRENRQLRAENERLRAALVEVRPMPKTLFSVIQNDDGTIEMEWHLSLYPVLDDDGKDTDRVIDFAEELVARLNGDDAEAEE